MNVNKETKFPEPFVGWFEITPAHDPEEVDDWFKRCIEDYPLADYGVKTGTGDYGLYRARVDWFDRWFSQFRNDKE